MTEAEIKNRIETLAAAIQADDERAGLAAMIALAGSALVDLNRIANALERLARVAAC